MVNIPLIDIKRQNDSLYDKLQQASERVIKSGNYINSQETQAFEKAMAQYVGVSHAIAVNSGTDALILSLKVAGVGAGDEVITSAYTFFATAEAIVQLGATPVFVDIEPHTYNINPKKIEAAITNKTKAIIPVHLFGKAANMDEIIKRSKKYDLAIIEDACQAIGASFKNKKIGSWGDFGCLSFYPTKNLGGLGDGGLILTDNEADAEQLRLYRTHGTYKKYHHSLVGYNTRLDELQAAFLNIKLREIDHWNTKRQTLAIRYNKAFNQLPVIPPHSDQLNDHVYHLYIIKTDEAKQLEGYLKQRGIAAGIYYPLGLHQQKALLGRHHKHDLSITETTAGTTLALPMFPELTIKEQDMVIKAVQSFFKQSY